MGFFNKYPYTDFHELNADWLIKEMQDLDKRLDEALQTLSTQIYNQVMTDIEPQLNSLRSEMTLIENSFFSLFGEFAALDQEFDDFKIYVDGKLLDIQHYVDNSVANAYEYTNNQIEENNVYLLDQMQTYLSQIKVINFFTGEMISIQDMFDYLASLHTTDSLDYDTMALRAKTYTELAGFNKTYTDLVMTGNTWYV